MCTLFYRTSLKTYQLDTTLFQNYKLGVKFCRNIHKNGGVCMYIQESCQFSDINVQNFCKEKDLEVCGIKLCLLKCTIGILSIYRTPSGNFEYFLNKLETLLNCISIN